MSRKPFHSLLKGEPKEEYYWDESGLFLHHIDKKGKHRLLKPVSPIDMGNALKKLEAQKTN